MNSLVQDGSWSIREASWGRKTGLLKQSPIGKARCSQGQVLAHWVWLWDHQHRGVNVPVELSFPSFPVSQGAVASWVLRCLE